MTTCPLAGSVNKTGPEAPAGTVLGPACVQVEVASSHNHVSPSTVKPEAPPNKTSFWIFWSYAIEAACGHWELRWF
jgi:hypothetical protein